MLKSSHISEFQSQVYDAVKLILKGKITTYKNIAIYLNKPGASQAIGNALRQNPFAAIVPCQRVLLSSYKIGGFLSKLHKIL